jgi:hypothetical protein
VNRQGEGGWDLRRSLYQACICSAFGGRAVGSSCDWSPCCHVVGASSACSRCSCAPASAPTWFTHSRAHRRSRRRADTAWCTGRWSRHYCCCCQIGRPGQLQTGQGRAGRGRGWGKPRGPGTAAARQLAALYWIVGGQGWLRGTGLKEQLPPLPPSTHPLPVLPFQQRWRRLTSSCVDGHSAVLPPALQICRHAGRVRHWLIQTADSRAGK